MLRIPLSAVAVAATSLIAFAAACGDDPAAAVDTGDSGARPATSSTGPSPSSTTSSNNVPDATTTPDSNAAPPVDAGPTTPVRFIAFGDTGKGCSNSADPQCAVAEAAKVKCATDGCDFAVLLGDNIYPSGATSPNDPIFETVFEQPYKDLNFPFYVALGNHDYGHNGAGTNFGVEQNEIGYTQNSQKWKMPTNFYKQSFGNGALDLVVTDTNRAMFGEEAAQRTQVKAWLAASTATWKIAVGHHPYKSNGDHGNAGCYDGYEVPGVGCVSVPPADGSGVKAFLEDSICGRADFYLCGHDHSRQWLADKCNGTELVVSGGGASTTSIQGKNAAHWEEASSGFFYVKIDGKTLTAEFISATGNVDFSRTVTKP